MAKSANIPWDDLQLVAGEPELQLADRIYETLQLAIVDGRIPPHTRLREVPLSQHFGASTTPVREALRRLDFDGLVQVQPRRGAVVATLDIDQIAELYELREVLEGEATSRSAIAIAGGADVTPVREIFDKMATAVDEPRELEFNQLDLVFHHTLNSVSGRHLLASEALRFHRQIQSVRLRCAVHLPGQRQESHADHERILEAAERGDAELAAALARAHVRSVRDAVVGVLFANPNALNDAHQPSE